jgi:hypothetical protein
LGGFKYNFRKSKKKTEDLELDFFSEYIKYYETDVKLYANPKNITFELNQSRELLQGENGIYYFDMWKGHSSTLFSSIFDLNKEKNNINSPSFFMNWIKCEGWDYLETYEEIPDIDILWFKNNLKLVIETLDNDHLDKNCFSHLYIFLEFVLENNWELRISNN